MHSAFRSLFVAVVALAATASTHAQSNSVPGTDIQLGILGNLKVWGRTGTFPAGLNGVSLSTTACNIGTQKVGWFPAMNPDHPFITGLFAREENGRLEQISNRSYVKHGFFATNQSSCGQCPNPGGDGNHLLPGCSDTYDVNNNGDQYYLGPPDEIDPWLGVWSSQCSLFDQGQPPVPPPQNCDNVRSFTAQQANALGPVGHRISLSDDDLNRPGATFWYQGMYVIKGEPEQNRDNNMVSRQFTPSWDGTKWTLASGTGQLSGSILKRWTGASVTSNNNGADDGRFYVAVKVTGPFGGLWHYEYAVQNRDNQRALGAFRVPIAANAQLLNGGFHDVDNNPATDWNIAHIGNEVVFDTPLNPQEWNTIYNFWFDSDAGPLAGAVSLGEFHPGAGAASISVQTTVPADLCLAPTIFCSAKTNSLGCVPSIAASGIPSASLGVGFTVDAHQVVSSVSGLLFYGLNGSAATPFQGGTLCVKLPLVRTGVQNSGGSPPNLDCSGNYSIDFNSWIASGADPALGVGTTVDAQYWSRDVNDPTGFGTSLSNAVEFTICN